ncbi:MAG: ribbon-helix-helix domain-containing protein [Myxococcaceae bacterium]
MSSAKVAITLEQSLLDSLDELVSKHVFKNRSQAIQEAVKSRLEHYFRSSFVRECEKLDSGLERAMADEGLQWDLEQWPIY